MSIVFSLGDGDMDGDAGRADVCMSMLVVLVSCVMFSNSRNQAVKQ